MVLPFCLNPASNFPSSFSHFTVTPGYCFSKAAFTAAGTLAASILWAHAENQIAAIKADIITKFFIFSFLMF
ncbi:MAG: hypothetical protein B7Y19_07165 [Sphingobacteriales bacterium 24-40-4]|nr:MAG: hypothetical protein B7Y19_07165 [Sphingobacteriales bacterium 24-40-4]